MSKKSGHLIIITGPSGVGKDSVIERMIEKGLRCGWIITTTTREKRKGEKEGKPYYFVSKKRFEEMIKNKELIEYENVYGNYYGCAKKEVEEKLRTNKIVIWKPDPVGALTIKKKFPEALTIFIAPPSFEILKKRLVGRATDLPEAIEKRLKKVKKEMAMAKDFDEIVVNEEGRLDKTSEKVLTIIKEYCKVEQ